MPAVTAKNLVKKYGDFTAVNSVSFAIPEGSCFGILGPNGAGKTTCAAMIYCFLPITGGTLQVLGMDVCSQPREIKARLGVVPQEDNLDTELTVLENLVIYASYFGIPRHISRERALQQLEFFALTEKAGSPVESLSGGMKRRLTIARGLMNDPELLILDEPTTGLDPEARHHIWQHLRMLKRQGLTILLTTHYLEEASQLCDSLVIMNSGKIIEEGSPAELVARHIGSQVIEISLSDYGSALLQSIDPLLLGRLTIGDTLYLYPGKNSETVMEKLASLPQRAYLLQRPANLEDVFLKLTGRGFD